MSTVRIQLRRGLAQDWVDTDPVLAAGEVGIESDTNKFKIGNNGDSWTELPYANITPTGLQDSLDDYLLVADRGVANGVASLDSSGLVPTSQLPALVKVTVSSVADQTARLALTAEPGDIAIQTDTGTSYVLSASPASTNSNWKELTATAAIDSAVQTAINNLIDGAPAALNTLNELAAAIADDASYATTITNALAAKASLSYVDTAIQNGAFNLSEHASDTTEVHGISDSAKLVYTDTIQEITGQKTFSGLLMATGTVELPAATTIGNLSSTEIGYLTTITSDVQGQLDTKAPIASPTFTGTVVLPPNTEIGVVSATEISYLNGVTSSIQTQIADIESDVNNLGNIFAPINSPVFTGPVNISQQLIFEGLTDDTHETTLTIQDPTEDRTVTIPNATGTVVLDGATQTLTNKTISYVDNTISIRTENINSLTAVAAELNILDGATITTAELNILDGVTATAAEINTLDGITATTEELNILDGATVDHTELNILDGATITTTELNYLDGVTSAIQTQLSSKASSTDLSNHESSSYNVHGITDTFNLVTKDGNQTLSNKTLNDPVVSGKIDLNGSYLNMGTNSNEQVTMKAKLVIDPSSDLLINVIPTSGSTQAVYAAWVEDNFISRNGQFGPTTDIDFGSKKITNLGTPTDDSDAATKGYVDASTAGLNVHDAVKIATTENLVSDWFTTPGMTDGTKVDNYNLVNGDRILVKDQTTPSQNGVYTASVGGGYILLTRASDYNSVGEVDAGDFIFVSDGAVNQKTGWVQTNSITTIGTDAISFTQFSGAGTYLAGTGLTLTGTTFSINTATTADLSTSQTLENKTLTSPVISTISNTGTVTLPTATDTLVGRATTDTLTNKTIDGANNTLTVRLANDVTGTLPVANGGTGITSFGAGISTFLGTPSSANLRTAVTDETGTGSLVFATSPTLVTPTLGAATATSIAFSDGTQSKEGVPSQTPISPKTSSFGINDGGTSLRDNMVTIDSTGSITVTVPADGTNSLTYPVGTSIDLLNINTGTVTVSGSGATVNGTPGLKLRTQWSSATLFKRAANTWVLMGDLSA